MNGGHPLRPRRGALAALAAACCLAQSCSRGEPTRGEPVRPVKSFVVQPLAPTESRSFSGRIVAAQEPDLAFQVSGLLARFPAREGQRLRKGDVIAEIRPDELEARLQTLQGQLDRAQADLRALRSGERAEERLRLESQVRAAAARLEHARVELERYAALIRENAVARSDYELVETEHRVATENHESALQMLARAAVARDEDIDAKTAEIRSLEGRLREAAIQLEDAVLRAPFDGVVAHRYVEENQNVAPGQPIVRFQDFEEVNISVDVPEAVMAADLRRPDIVSLVAELSAAPGRRFPVEFREIAQIADPTTQTFRVRLTMPAPEGVRLLPGMTAIVRVEHRRLAGDADSIFVPIAAVYRDPSTEAVVWVIGSDGVVERRPVTIGPISGGSIRILQGLRPGERIAAAGVSQIRAGMKVRDLGDALGVSPAAAAAGPAGGRS